MALRYLHDLPDGNDNQEGDHFGQTPVEFTGLLTPDALGDPKVKLIPPDDPPPPLYVGSEGRPGVTQLQQ